MALQHWRQHIWGRRFKRVADHAALIHLYYIQNTSILLTQWAIALQGVDFTVEHKSG